MFSLWLKNCVDSGANSTQYLVVDMLRTQKSVQPTGRGPVNDLARENRSGGKLNGNQEKSSQKKETLTGPQLIL